MYKIVCNVNFLTKWLLTSTSVKVDWLNWMFYCLVINLVIGFQLSGIDTTTHLLNSDLIK